MKHSLLSFIVSIWIFIAGCLVFPAKAEAAAVRRNPAVIEQSAMTSDQEMDKPNRVQQVSFAYIMLFLTPISALVLIIVGAALGVAAMWIIGLVLLLLCLLAVVLFFVLLFKSYSC